MPASGLMISNYGGVCVATFQQPSLLDGPVIDAINGDLAKLVDEQAHRKLVLDFTSVRFLSSSMLGVLVSLRKKADTIKGELVLVGLAADLMKVFTVSRLDSLFQFAKNEDEAFRLIGGKGQ